jgi:hypothetical protein
MNVGGSRDSNHGGAAPNEAVVVVRICGHSEVGRVREHNEDTFRIEDLTNGAPGAEGARARDREIRRASDRRSGVLVAAAISMHA